MRRLIKGIIIMIMGFIFAQTILSPQETKAWEISLPGKFWVTPNGLPICVCPRITGDCVCIIDIF